MSTPRCFIIRHGETEWSLNGRHTGTTDLPLTSNGERRIIATGRALVGRDRLIVPQKLAKVFVSPRQRAQKTLELLATGYKQKQDELQRGAAVSKLQERADEVDVSSFERAETTHEICEWNYGEYEGLRSVEINERRKAEGKEVPFNIWQHGCPGGESPQQVTERCDKLIKGIREVYHKSLMEKAKNDDKEPCDVLVVAHGHILRAFAARWIGRNLTDNPSMILEAGGFGTLSYEHHNINEPAIVLGGAFAVDAVEKNETKDKN